MKLTILTRVAASFCVVIATAAYATQPDAQQILAASDAVRNPGRAFAVTTTLLEYREAKQVGSNTLSVYSKVDTTSGQFRSLIRFVAPVRDANKMMLKNGNDLWFFDPSSKATIRISPQQRLLGQASNGDVVTVNFARDYRAALEGEENIQDGDRQSRQAYRLKLEAQAAEVTYPRIEMWVDAQNSRPIKGKFYALSGQLLKTAYYRKYQLQLGTERPTEMVIVDGLDPQWVTVMRYSDYAFRDVPDAWLQRDYLARFKPE